MKMDGLVYINFKWKMFISFFFILSFLHWLTCVYIVGPPPHPPPKKLFYSELHCYGLYHFFLWTMEIQRDGFRKRRRIGKEGIKKKGRTEHLFLYFLLIHLLKQDLYYFNCVLFWYCTITFTTSPVLALYTFITCRWTSSTHL
jgi:hypothetical protein